MKLRNEDERIYTCISVRADDLNCDCSVYQNSSLPEMDTVVPAQASRAIEEQLKTLCLREFPCGSGPWVIYS